MIKDLGEHFSIYEGLISRHFFDDQTKYHVYIWKKQDKDTKTFLSVGQVYDKNSLCIYRHDFHYLIKEDELIDVVRDLIKKAKPRPAGRLF